MLEEFIFNLSNTFGNLYVIIPLLLMVGVSTYTDVKRFKIYNKHVCTLLILRILLGVIPFFEFPFTVNHISGAFIGIIILWIPAVHFMWKMGGDFKLIFVIGLFLGAEVMFLFLAISFIYCAIFALIKKLRNKSLSFLSIKIPFAVGFFCSLSTLTIINFFY